MSYYETIEEDLARAKAILAEGKPSASDLQEVPLEWHKFAAPAGTIFGKDIYAAYKLLESFVAEIERLRA
jgi:hypothetical protein